MSTPPPPLPSGPPVFVSDPSLRAIASIWRRIAAAIIDGFILAIPCTLLAIPFFDPLSRLGAWGGLIGFLIALPYFAYFNSDLGNGQTLGKRWMQIQVVDIHGNRISFSKSVIRYVLLFLPFTLNEISLPTSRTPRALSVLLSLVIMGLGGANAYLVLFNRRSRQGVHDLAAQSYVADSVPDGPLHPRAIWKPNIAILGSLLAIFLVFSLFSSRIEKSKTFGHMFEDIRLIEAMPGVQSAGIQDLTNWSPGEKTRGLVVNVLWTGDKNKQDELAAQITQLVLQNDPTARDRDFLNIVITRGYSLGIAQAHLSQGYIHSRSEWTGPPDQ